MYFYCGEKAVYIYMNDFMYCLFFNIGKVYSDFRVWEMCKDLVFNVFAVKVFAVYLVFVLAAVLFYFYVD